MKALKILFIIIFISFSSNAQDPQLLENTWYLQNVTYEGVDFFPPSADFVTELYFYPDSFNYIYTICNYGWATGDINYNANNLEFILGNEFIGVGDGCNNQEFIDFMIIHDTIYYVNYVDPLNPFTYVINESNSYLQLIITNTNGDSAIYGNELLSNQEFNKLIFDIYPNPVTNILQINTRNNVTIKNVQIYNVLGEKLLEAKKVNQINVSTLASGLFFVKIETDYGIVVKKVVKE